MAVVDFSMQNKIAIVTGGSKGIGRAIALAFAEHGADIVIAARGTAALESTKKEIEATGRRCIAISADMANEADWERLVVKTVAVFGAVDVLVNNAATADKLGPVHETSGEAWDLTMQVNLKAPFFLSKLCQPHMIKRGGGSIIHITSDEAVRPTYGIGSYSVSKGALVTLTEVCAKEWARNNIRVNCIAPGLIRTEMAAELIDMVERTGKHFSPLKRIGEPEEIAGIALFLASPAGKFATGQMFVVDGGDTIVAPTDPVV